MFTGLIKEIGTIKNRDRHYLSVSAKNLLQKLKKGDSINVDGICLTVTKITSEDFSADLSPETLARTTAKFFKTGQKVNLEPALVTGEPLGGHIVTGHVDGVGQIKEKQKSGEFLKMTFQIPAELAEFIVTKGSIAIDGISLTVNEIKNNLFSVMLIPETIKNTALASKKIGEPVNIETDILLKSSAKKKPKEKTSGLTLGNLEKAGFI